MSTDGARAAEITKPLILKELRVQCRARGISPGGSREALADRLAQHMVATQDFELKQVAEDGTVTDVNGGGPETRGKNNNYSRPDGQNVGNFITDRPSSRVLAPPGGGSNWALSDAGPVAQPKPAARVQSSPWGTAADLPAAQVSPGLPAGVKVDVEVSGETRGKNNNYMRPAGQNVGNFITDKPSSRVLAPPGGGSNICFG